MGVREGIGWWERNKGGNTGGWIREGIQVGG